MAGQIVDASLVPAPKQGNTEAEKAAIKETNARWTLKVGGTLRYRPDATPLPQTAVPVFGVASTWGAAYAQP